MLAGLGVWIGIGVASVAGIEEPKYTVTATYEGFEVREYAPYIVAQVTVEGAFDDALNQGFRKIADYIFGNNTKRTGESSEKIAMTAPVIEQGVASEKIAMTAPVIEQDSAGNTRVVAFVMPSSYTMETLPTPNNPEVRLVPVAPKRFAVMRFSGNVSEADAASRKQELRDLVKAAKLETVGEPLLAQYNPPWTPPFMRRNEVLLELK